ncbi:hypothetical protein DERP_007964 [Dermatophagoides pteronyssinus]|uniref:Uncharacterized protein n=1 Tax=Dermatophagoides pteronyssinus TaxID=6956 RepID=A0ABQ8ITF3_DERPT|nr:hypothetical protein DERP_007964 [Dermatophagoides pteronyssinus]
MCLPTPKGAGNRVKLFRDWDWGLGSKSRNKVSVGEPAEGSLSVFLSIYLPKRNIRLSIRTNRCPLSQMDRLAIVDIDEVIESSEIVSWFSCWATWMKTMGEFLNLGAGPNHVNFVGDSP